MCLAVRILFPDMKIMKIMKIMKDLKLGLIKFNQSSGQFNPSCNPNKWIHGTFPSITTHFRGMVTDLVHTAQLPAVKTIIGFLFGSRGKPEGERPSWDVFTTSLKFAIF